MNLGRDAKEKKSYDELKRVWGYRDEENIQKLKVDYDKRRDWESESGMKGFDIQIEMTQERSVGSATRSRKLQLIF